MEKGILLPEVEGLIQQPVDMFDLRMSPRDMRVNHPAEFFFFFLHLQKKAPDVFGLHPVFARKLAGHQFAVKKVADFLGTGRLGELEADQNRRVFGDIVGGLPDSLPMLFEHPAPLIEDEDADRGRAWIAAGTAIGINLNFGRHVASVGTRKSGVK